MVQASGEGSFNPTHIKPPVLIVKGEVSGCFYTKNVAHLEGPENITPDGTKSTTAPEPEVEQGKFKCPICQATFQSKRQYYSHAFDDHKIGTGVSTAIY